MTLTAQTDRTPETSKRIPHDRVIALRNKLRGTAVLPGEHGYDAARTIWNAMIDRHPALAVHCQNAADVVEAVTFARENDLEHLPLMLIRSLRVGGS
jgi:hypothetical protein